LARIVPLHYLTCLIFLIFVSPLNAILVEWPMQIGSHLFFFHNLTPRTLGSINGPNWSLGVEMQFYLLMMLITPWLIKARVGLMVAVAVGVSWAWRAGSFALFHGKTADGFNLTWVATGQLFGMLDLFAMGVGLAMLTQRDGSGRFRVWLGRWWVWGVLGWVMGSLVMKVYWKRAEYWPHWYMVTFWMTGLGVMWLLVLMTACGMRSRALSFVSAPLRYLGTISYGIYLWHMPVMSGLNRVYPAGGNERYLAMTIFVTFIFAAGSWHFFEKPFMDRLARGRAVAR
jgi:peptidoglycan/LPS O-acetylase OafA/YrhL